VRAVLERDFLFEASRTRAVVLRTLLAALVAAAILVAVLAGSDEFRNNPDQVGLQLFRIGAGAMLGMILLLAPPVVVGSVLAERQQETLPLVLATPIGPYRFALAKLLSRTAVVALLAAAALPSLALTTVFGGVSGRQVLDLACLAAGVALELTAWSLWVSTASRRLATAVVLSYVAPFARWALVILVFGWTMDERPWDFLSRFLLPFLASLCTTPLPGLAETMEPGAAAILPPWLGPTPSPSSPAGLLLAFPAQAYLLFSLFAAAAAVAAAGRRLRFEAEPKGSLIARSRLGRRLFRRGSPGENPVAWKEVRLLNTASSRPLFYTVLGVLLLTEVLFLKTAKHGDEALGLITVEVTLLCLLAAANGAAILGQERSQGSYDLLRASPLTPGQILKGKAAGVLAGLLLLATVPLGHALLAVKENALRPRTFFAVAALSLLVPWGWAALGMATATHAPRIRTAVVRTMAAFATCLAGLPLLGYGILETSGWNSPGQAIGEWLAFACPPACLFGFLDGFNDGNFRYSHLTWQAYDEQTYGLFWTVIYLGLSAVLTLTLRRRLVRALERDREGG